MKLISKTGEIVEVDDDKHAAELQSPAHGFVKVVNDHEDVKDHENDHEDAPKPKRRSPKMDD